MKDLILAGRTVAISISNSPDLAVLGLGQEHLDDAMTEIARHLIACGASLAYGGDLREGGFTELLFEIVARYRSNKDVDKVIVSNYLAWPVHSSMTAEQIQTWQSALAGLANIILLDRDGLTISLPERALGSALVKDEQWADSLTAMRNTMASNISARVALGGQTAKYKGRLPGIAEEALFQLKRKEPLFVLGGFGGCSFDVARAMGIARSDLPRSPLSGNWNGIETFRHFGPADLHNGLSIEENRALAETVHVDQAVALILRGLMKTPKRRRPRKR